MTLVRELTRTSELFSVAAIAIVVTTVLASTVVLVAGEILPKTSELGHAKTYALRIVGPLRYVELPLYPAVSVSDALTRTVSTRMGGDQSIEQPYDGSTAETEPESSTR